MNEILLRILIIEDSEDDTFLLLRELKKGGYKVNHKRVDNKVSLKKALLKHDWDLILTDHNMPDFDSISALKVIKKLDVDLPVIIVSGSIGEDVAVAAMKAGAHDYIMKNNLSRLIPAIERELREASLRKSKRMTEAAIEYLAFHDSLTGLVNRTEFERRLQRAIEHTRKNKIITALLYMDLDQFKIVNDTCGHSAGDELLKQLSSLLLARIRGRDTLARLGGDEFCVLLENCNQNQAVTVANELLKLVNDFHFFWDGKFFTIGVSIGIVTIDKNSADQNEILGSADLACYAAKDQGRNCIQVYRDEDTSIRQWRADINWANRIDVALENNQLVLYQQRIQSLNDEKIHHHEFLLRLNDENKIITPGTFIPAAERHQKMVAIDRWVINNAFLYLYNRKEKCNGHHLININLSGQSLSNSDLFNHIYSLFMKYDLAPKSVCFEITETATIANFHTAIDIINRLKEIGCLIALDDFGCGLSSFSYLKNMNIDFLKIDGSFIRNIDKNRIDRSIVESINNISHVAGFKTIAEYVETKKIANILKDIGIDYAQGYCINKPHPLNQEIHFQKISNQ